jgi:tetratricopeptide (TPR) repeat protein
VEKGTGNTAQNYTKAIDYSKKVLANYPKSKWVDDAYLLWARALLGRDDPRETVNLLQDFPTRFPDSRLKAEALFYLGVGYRQSHRYSEAELSFEQFLALAPKHGLAPYAWLERSRALTSLDRDSAAAFCAGQVLDRFPRSNLGPQALAARSEALLAAGDQRRARADYQALGLRARSDEERLGFLHKEADCLEAGQDYEQEVSLLKDALGHTQPPATGTGEGGVTAATYQAVAGGDHYGRLLLRIGTVHLLAGRLKEALDAYQEVAQLYPKSPLSAEARYRVGYSYETSADDFTHARSEYMRVREEVPSSVFATQAQSRITNLDRVTQFRTTGGDTLAKRAEAGFLMAELYLFQLDKPERALEEYRKVAAAYDSTRWAAKALNAEAWVLSRKLGREAEAESLFWVVVRQYPATEAQLAARDYLEKAGVEVPDSLIQLPKEPEPVVSSADTVQLTPLPTEPMPLGSGAGADSAYGRGRPGARGPALRMPRSGGPALDPRYSGSTSGAPSIAGDSPFTPGRGQADADSLVAPPRSAPPDTSGHAMPGLHPAPPDTSGHATPGTQPAAPDTTRPAVPDTTRSGSTPAGPPRPDSTRIVR